MNTKTRFLKIAKYVSQLLLTEDDMTCDVNYIHAEVSKVWAQSSLIPNEKLEKRFVNQVISQLKRQNIIELISKDGRNNKYKVSDETTLMNIESGDHILKQMNKQSIIQLKQVNKNVTPEKPAEEVPQSTTPYADKIKDIPLSPLEIGMGICELIGSQNDKINTNVTIIDSLKQDIVDSNGALKFQEKLLSKSEDSRLDLEDEIKEMGDKIARDAKQHMAKEKQLNNQIGRLTEIITEKDENIVKLQEQPHPEIKLSTMSQLSAIKINKRI